MRRRSWLTQEEIDAMRRRAFQGDISRVGTSADVLRLADEVDALRATLKAVMAALKAADIAAPSTSEETLHGWNESGDTAAEGSTKSRTARSSKSSRDRRAETATKTKSMPVQRKGKDA